MRKSLVSRAVHHLPISPDCMRDGMQAITEALEVPRTCVSTPTTVTHSAFDVTSGVPAERLTIEWVFAGALEWNEWRRLRQATNLTSGSETN